MKNIAIRTLFMTTIFIATLTPPTYVYAASEQTPPLHTVAAEDIPLASGVTPLMLAISNGNTEVIKRMLQENQATVERIYQGADNNKAEVEEQSPQSPQQSESAAAQINTTQASDFLPLMFAIMNNDVTVIQQMLQDCDTDSPGAEEQSPQAQQSEAAAAASQAAELEATKAKAELERKAALDKQLRNACQNGYDTSFSQLIKAGADFNAVDPETDDSPLTIAAAAGKEEIVGMLLKQKADPDHANKAGKTAQALLIEYYTQHARELFESYLPAEVNE